MNIAAKVLVHAPATTTASLADGKKAFANREYVWKNVPREIADWRFTIKAGGDPATIQFSVRRGGLIYAVTGQSIDLSPKGWQPTGMSFSYYGKHSKRDKASKSYSVKVSVRTVRQGERIALPLAPQDWVGCILVFRE